MTPSTNCKMTSAFLGEWKMISSENFDEVLKEMGVGFVLRKMAGTTKPNVKFEQNGDEWTFSTLSALKTSVIKYKLGEEFEEERMDGNKVKTVIVFENGKLIQTQKDKDGKVVTVIEREITGENKLKAVSRPSPLD